MSNESSKYYMGDIFVGDLGFGFAVSDSRGGATEPTIGDEAAQKIVTVVKGNIDAPLGSVNLFEISQEEFEAVRDGEITSLGLPQGLQVWRLKNQP